MLRRQLTIIVAAISIIGCGQGEIPFAENTAPDPDELECVGNPDGQVICWPKDDVWDCLSMPNGEVKCSKTTGPPPDGSNDWDCVHDGENVVCTKDGPMDGPPLGEGTWDCIEDGEQTICTSQSSQDVPDGSSDWNCIVNGEFLVTCEGTPDPDSDLIGDTPPGDTPPGDTPPGVPPSEGHDYCFWPLGPTAEGVDPNEPIATIDVKSVTLDGVPAIHVRLTFAKYFVDNTYGANSSDGYGGKDKQHTFEQLLKSDHAILYFYDKSGKEVVATKIDYITESPNALSGYASLGVDGGDGAMIAGPRDAVLHATSSLSRNFNDHGYVLTVDSPATDANYTANSNYPKWDFSVAYEVYLRKDAFGSAGYGDALIDSVHASPARTATDTFDVESGPCP